MSSPLSLSRPSLPLCLHLTRPRPLGNQPGEGLGYHPSPTLLQPFHAAPLRRPLQIRAAALQACSFFRRSAFSTARPTAFAPPKRSRAHMHSCLARAESYSHSVRPCLVCLSFLLCQHCPHEPPHTPHLCALRHCSTSARNPPLPLLPALPAMHPLGSRRHTITRSSTPTGCAALAPFPPVRICSALVAPRMPRPMSPCQLFH